MTVLPKRYRIGPLFSFKTITLPGVNSVIVPESDVVVVVVVVSETCAQAKGDATAKALINNN